MPDNAPVTDPDVNTGEETKVETRSARDIMLEDLGEQQETNRATVIAEGLAEDPGAAAIQGRIEQQQAENRTAAEEEGLLEPVVVEPKLTGEEIETGVTSIEPMHDPEPESQLPTELQDDPLADFIVMDGDTPKVALRISGQDMLMDVGEAKRRLQIRTAAEIELQTSRNFQKDLNRRADELSAGEQALQARMGQVATPEADSNSAPTQAALSEDEIRGEAVDIFKTAFSGTEDEAADKLTKLLTRVQAPVVVQQTPIDRTAIVKEAATIAVGAIDERDQKKDLVDGLNRFRDEYPDINGDATLYRLCDDMTDGIAVENPSWSKSQVMLEAGKRTRKWVEDLRGTPTTVEEDDVDVTTDEPEISEPTQPLKAHDRQARKAGLVRIPAAAAGAVNQPEETVDENPQSATEALKELRQSRGQPV